MAAPTFDALLGALLLHGHAAGDVSGLPAAPLVDTRANVLAATPDADGQVGFATDARRCYIAVNGGWLGMALPLGTPSVGVDIGVFPFEDDRGYGEFDLSDKTVHNIILGGFDASKNTVPGAFEYNRSVSLLRVFIGGEWRTVITMTPEELLNVVRYTDDFNNYDPFGKNLVHGHQTDIGVFASDHFIDGGLISDQL